MGRPVEQALDGPASSDGGARRGPGPAFWLSLARALRDFGDGFVAVLLAVYLTELGHGPLAVGLIATAALFGSALTTLLVGRIGARYGERRLLLLASALMTATGLAFTLAPPLALLVVIAFVGTANPSAGNVSVFVPLEHAVLAGHASAADRTRLFAAYGLAGAFAAAAGSLAAASPELLAAAGWSRMDALKAMFALYALLGIAGGACYWRLPPDLRTADAPPVPLGPSRRVVYRLAALFSIDAFAGGFAVQSLMALWLFAKFGMSLAAASLFFFWSGLLAAFSYPASAWLAKRIGLVNTMVFTHIPANFCLVGAALAPSLEPALALLLVRSALSQMDVPARSSYVMAVVTPAERAAAASLTAVPRSLASAASPALAGALFASGAMALPFVICGVLKTLYDLTLLWMFRRVKPPEEG